MGLREINGWWYFVMRVPRRFAGVDGRQQVRKSLRTDSKEEAKAKAPAVKREFMAYWEALEAGQTSEAASYFEAAKRLCEARGYRYRRAAELSTDGAAEELAGRVLAMDGQDLPAEAEAVAMLGLAEPPKLMLSQLLDRFFPNTQDRVKGKSEQQAHRWRLERKRAVANLLAAVGEKPVAELTREDVLVYRAAWQAKLDKTGQNPESANKDFGHLGDVFRTTNDLLGLKLDGRLFDRIRFKRAAHKTEVPPFSESWIKDRLLAHGALDGLNQEARDALLVMVNTGARPLEILGALAEDFVTEAEIPHLAIRPRPGRALKTPQSEREVPLVGVSLEAARRLKAAGGPSRYFMKSDNWSAAVNKFLGQNGLRETDEHRAYSLRHAFEDRLLEAGVDERLRVELMGHKYNRPAYGRGGSLGLKAEAVARIAL